MKTVVLPSSSLLLETAKALVKLTPEVEQASPKEKDKELWHIKRDAYLYLRAVIRLASYESETPLGFEEPSTWREYAAKAWNATKATISYLRNVEKDTSSEVRTAIDVILNTLQRTDLDFTSNQQAVRLNALPNGGGGP